MRSLTGGPFPTLLLFHRGEIKMPDFEPQFHKRMALGAGKPIWVALPNPKSELPVKAEFYQKWQMEERMRLEKAGETVASSPKGR
jgi:hypothetical protein